MTRKNWIRALVCGTCLLVCVSAPPADAQEPRPNPEHRREMEERIREHFSSMLRSELALSDEQAENVLPAMAELEQSKREAGRERRETVRALQTGMREGASDTELQMLLDRLEEIEDDQRSAERNAMAEIDADLSTRQRVELRFFVQQFRRRIEARLSNRAERMERHRSRQEGSRQPNRP